MFSAQIASNYLRFHKLKQVFVSVLTRGLVRSESSLYLTCYSLFCTQVRESSHFCAIKRLASSYTEIVTTHRAHTKSHSQSTTDYTIAKTYNTLLRAEKYSSKLAKAKRTIKDVCQNCLREFCVTTKRSTVSNVVRQKVSVCRKQLT